MDRPGKPFLPGRSGNPAGLSKRLTALKARAEAMAMEALEGIYDLAKNADEERIRFEARKYIVDRAGLVPPKPVEITLAAPNAYDVSRFSSMSTADLLALEAKEDGEGDA